jgi:DUF4097 and DUF4098 domain-containing protein YvlB
MKTIKNTLSLTFIIVAILLICFGCVDVSVNPTADINGPDSIIDHKYKARESFSDNADVTSQSTLKVENINGNVNVKAVSGTDRITISAEKIVGSDTNRDAYASLKNITIELNELTNELIVKTIQPEFSDGRSYSVNYTIGVPSYLNVIVNNVNGKISGLLSVPTNGTVDLNLQNGTIDLDIPQNTSADFSASLVNGYISVQNLTLHNRVATNKLVQGKLGNGEGVIALRTTNGDINVSGF